jgi:catechol 2,3-dioxygenase-like lactoylglutathione lyase family enzyme
LPASTARSPDRGARAAARFFFYAHRLGALPPPLYQDPGSGRRAGAPLAAGWGQIAFALGSADAVDRLTDRLAAAGPRVVEPPHRSWEGSSQSVVLDPDGNRIELTV